MIWNPTESSAEPAEVAGLASTRTFPLKSSFAPSYNMTINLVQQMGPEQARSLLAQSFAQYQADRSVVGLVRGAERGEQLLDEIAAEIGGHDSALLDYVRLRAKISNANAHRRVRHGSTDARPPTRRWRRCGAATSSTCPRVAAAGLRWCWSRRATTRIRARWC